MGTLTCGSTILLLVSVVAGFTTKSSLGVESQVGRTMIFELEAKMTCFYETLERDMIYRLSIFPYPMIKSKFPLQLRLTSPSGDFSEWANGDGEAKMSHNTTEDGDYEICFFAPRPIKISFNSFFHHPEKVEKSFQDYLDKHQLNANIKETVSKLFQFLYNILYSVKFYNQISVRDEAMQQTNAHYIQLYSLVFCGSTLLLAIIQVALIRRMFRIDTKRIRI